MQAAKKLMPGEIPTCIMEYILKSLQDICYGQVILVAQDAQLVEVERREKLRLADWKRYYEKVLLTTAAQKCLSRRICQSFSHLRYGQLVIVVKNGKIVQIELTEKYHFTGLEGEGI